MSPKIIAGGSLKGKMWTTHITDENKSTKFAGFRLSDQQLAELIDSGAEWVVFVDPNLGRFTSTIDDWQDYGVRDGIDEWVHLRQSWMDR